MKNFWRFIFILILTVTLLSALVVSRGRVKFPGQAGPGFDAAVDMTHRDEIAREKPEIVLLGDSMVEENLIPAAFSEALGRKVYTVSYPGSASAMWYLSVKNNILASPHKPKALILLFRDSTLTTPYYRVNGNFIPALDLLAGTNETVLLQRSYLTRINPLEKFARTYLPIFTFGAQAQSMVDIVARYRLSHSLLHCGKRCVDTAFLNIFSFRTLAPPAADDPVAREETILYTDGALDFYSRVDDSYLPEIIRMCRENGIQLILVRGKTISFVGIPEPIGLSGYMQELEIYLTENSVRYADLEPDSRLGTAEFIDRFHVIPEARGTYTQMLAEAVIPLLP